ncbi:hypothetical protein DUNSADRAFT_10033 [Dunaliella salina]|uniref:Encoded protein n=1 Tax=Dunaliella salina TaxID=3046 RepID=A0ABQ7GG87_DUNSA|nr:hypothetical protein DUNSADRAFT_10033 [Dunaliella salina]|eukprot:KAF5833617.1 hypothetical protein DUNSADRAFT_10033 [Dunaliella salina]
MLHSGTCPHISGRCLCLEPLPLAPRRRTALARKCPSPAALVQSTPYHNEPGAAWGCPAQAAQRVQGSQGSLESDGVSTIQRQQQEESTKSSSMPQHYRVSQADPFSSTASSPPPSISFSTSPSASLTRMMLMAPTPSLRALTNRKLNLSGPMSFLLFVLGIFLALMAAVRRVLVRRVKACKTCKAFGLIRCRLCDGEGSVLWRGKVNHEETCPLCLTKRYVTCPDCGGHYHRPMFVHRQNRTGRGLIPDFMLRMNG